MTDLADVAMAFCKECLGWENAFISEQWPHAIFDGTQERRERIHLDVNLKSNDLNQVIPAVHKWTQQRGITFSLDSRPDGSFRATIWSPYADIADHQSHDYFIALLSAAVSANRKMKEGV